MFKEISFLDILEDDWMPVYVINDSLSRLIYKGLSLSELITCMESKDGRSLSCRHVDSSDGVRVELVDKWNIRIIIDSKYVLTGNSSYYKVMGGAGKTLFYALKTLANIPVYRSSGLRFIRNVEVIDNGGMIIIILDDVVAIVGRDNYVSISSLFMGYEDNSLIRGELGRTGKVYNMFRDIRR